MESNIMLDENFEKIENLKSFPRIGNSYIDQSTKVMIVGESHYTDDPNKTETLLRDRDWTREEVLDRGIGKVYEGVKIYKNIHHVLARNDDFDTEELWENVVYYNFIQELMVHKSRPTHFLF
jgi:hypothetical protein